MKEQPNYYAVIPADVRYSEKLIPSAKLLYGEITALSNQKGFCWAKDSYFQERYSVSKTTIQNWLKSLEDNGFITRQVFYKEGSKEILNRSIRILVSPMQEKLNDPMQEKLRDNIKSFNTKDNTRKRIYEESSEYMKLTKYLYKKIQNNHDIKENLKEEQAQKWSNELRLMVERDKRSVEDIMAVIDFSQNDNFWSKNILSARKLRKQFITLKAQLPKENKSNDKNNMFSGINLKN